MFTHTTKVRMHDTDAAGRIFFASQLKMAHDAYEEFFTSIGLPLFKIVEEGKFFIPIVHTQADYKRVLFVGDVLAIQVNVGRIGETSFELDYELLNDQKEIVGTAKTIHVAVSPSQEKIPLPGSLREALLKAQ